MKFLLVSRIDNRDALAFIGTIRSLLEKEGCDGGSRQRYGRPLGEKGVLLGGAKADVVIVVGGDGTILRTVQHMKVPIPLLAVNWGEVGFLADLDPVEALPFIRTLPGGFSVDERMRIALHKDRTRSSEQP